MWLIGLPHGTLTPFGPRIKPCLKHRLVTTNGRILLHMSIHLGVEVQGEEALQETKGLCDDMLGDTVIFDIEESTLRAGIVYIFGDSLSYFE